MRKPFLQPQTKTLSRSIETSPIKSQADQREILTVSQLNRHSKRLIESNFSNIWLEGEISNLVCAASGHWYLTLKDSQAQIKCAFFKFKNRLVNLNPKDGDKVVVKGKVSLYEARGDYQMIIDYMEPAGLGDLQQELNALIKKLAANDLFSSENKQPLPYLPKAIGVITSPTGAAIHDVITVLQRRCPMVPIIIYPTQVQGKVAAKSIINALQKAINRQECDVLLMTRGGGSLEDLWCFNSEELAYEIAGCPIPIVAAIGHEVDLTITELVADLRAATPSAAAELIAPDQQSLWQRVDINRQELIQNIASIVNAKQNSLNIARLKLRDPEQVIAQSKHRLAQLKNDLIYLFQQNIQFHQDRIYQLKLQLAQQHPQEKLSRDKHRLERLVSRLKIVINKQVNEQKNQLSLFASKLDTLSPLSTLSRGYSIVRDKELDKVINKISQTEPNEKINILLSDGTLICKVEEIMKDEQTLI